jgi:L,D-peptidoglycan transpeptidase YkuD (ErfK/YbiS/YcfS/YnhG family)
LTPNDLVVTPRGLRFRGRVIPCVVGRGGVAEQKREGDGATPAGTVRITAILYRADRIARPARWASPIGPSDLWSDDPSDPRYNQRVVAPHGYSHELLRRGDRLYDLVLVTDWNVEGIAGRGSAIFLHRWRRPCLPTAGCIAMSPTHLRWLAQRIQRGTRVMV